MLENDEIQFGILLEGEDKLPLYFDSIKKKYNKNKLVQCLDSEYSLKHLFSNYIKENEHLQDDEELENIDIVFSVYDMWLKINELKGNQYEFILKIGSDRFIPRHSLLEFGYVRPVDFYRRIVEVFIDILNDDNYLLSNRFTEGNTSTLIECA